MYYKSFRELKKDVCSIYGAVNNHNLKKFWRLCKGNNIDFCDPAPGMYCLKANVSIAFDAPANEQVFCSKYDFDTHTHEIVYY